MVTLMPCNYLNAQNRCTMIDKMCEPKVKRSRADGDSPAEKERLISDTACSPHSGHSSSTCESPPPVTAPTVIHTTPDTLSSSPSTTIATANFTPAWSLLDTQGVKTEIRSPGLAETDCVATTQDSASFYSTPIDLGNLYDKDYHQTYSAAHSYYNSIQPSYGSTSSTTPYINSASSFYNASSYPYSGLNSTRTLNPACKVSAGYIASSYSSPASPFNATGQSSQYSSYAAYTAPGASGFTQGFNSQGVDYSSYSSTYPDSQTSQFASSYYAQSYSPYVSSPSSSGSIGPPSYQLTSPSILEKIDLLAPIATKKIGKHICKKCNDTFSNIGNLNMHIKRKHPEHFEELVPIKKKVFKCKICELQFNLLKKFTDHKREHAKRLKCPLCQQEYASKQKINQHYNENHLLNIQTEALEFPCFDDFLMWKAKIEKDTFSSFINLHGSGKNPHIKRITYGCHRSGDTKSRGLNIRALKTQGSNKINGYCPAFMSVIVQESKCMVNFCKTHVGHRQEEDIGHLFLSLSDRQNVAAKIAAKIPLQTILDKVRDSVANCHLERIHLLTKKDLYNIENIYNLNKTSIRHKNDAISVDAWVNELNVSGSVLFYKPQGIASTNNILKEEDFFLAIMTEAQKDLLLRFGDDSICIDGTHGLNGYGFELHTILVLDDLREGYPCSFLISNRSDAEVIKIFFICVQERIGKKIQPKVFMSDMAESYYNAWVQVMNPAEFRLYCTWHVDKAWRKNLNKIPNKETKAFVYKMLRMLLQETDVYSFNIMLQKFLTFCQQNSATIEFGKYFELYYGNKVEQWAYCFRLRSGLNTNMHLERMHRTIKYLYLNSRYTKRLDKALSAIMKFVRDKSFERLIVLHKGKVCTKLSNLRQRHKNSETLDITKVVQSETGWIVPSTSGKELYVIEELQTECRCHLVCSQCSVCIHRFTCSCLDNSIKWNMCKHVHLVAQFIKQNPKSPAGDESFSDNLVIDTTINDKLEESINLIKSISCKKDERQILIEEQQRLLAAFQQQVLSTRSLEEIELIKKCVAPIKPSLEAIRNIRPNNLFKSLENIPKNNNKKIEPQIRLFTTTKKQKKQMLSTPSVNEIDVLAVQLLNQPFGSSST